MEVVKVRMEKETLVLLSVVVLESVTDDQVRHLLLHWSGQFVFQMMKREFKLQSERGKG